MRFEKDPDARLEYGIDWSTWLGDDTIAASTWTADDGLTIETSPAPHVTDGKTVVWLSGGQVRQEHYRVVNRITTAGGRVDERSLWVRVLER